jgi:hypothetical protein
MKKILKSMKDTIVSAVNNVSRVANKIIDQVKVRPFAAKLAESNGNFVVDHAATFAIIIAVAAVIITALIAYIKGDFSTLLTGKIGNLFG